jgi:hypothetical protein
VVVPCRLVRVWWEFGVGTGPGMPRGLGCNLRPIYWWRNFKNIQYEIEKRKFKTIPGFEIISEIYCQPLAAISRDSEEQFANGGKHDEAERQGRAPVEEEERCARFFQIQEPALQFSRRKADPTLDKSTKGCAWAT